MSTTRTVTSLLTCWSQNTEFPECPGSNHSCLNFNETHAVSPSKSLPPLGTRTSNSAELGGREADYPQCTLANLLITRAQLRPILCNPKDCSLPDSSAHRIFQARVLEFHCRGLECKSRKSRNTCSNRQIGLGVQNEAGQRLIEFCQENALVIANTLF